MVKSNVAFHASNRLLRALVLRQVRRGWAVVAGASRPLADDAEDLTADLKALAKQLKLHGRQPATLCLGRQQAILRGVLLPSTDPAELAQMARFEADRHIPFNAERHCVGYHIMSSKGVEGSEVLLAAVDGPIVDRGLAGLQNAGFVPDGITITSPALINSLCYQQKDDFKQQTQAIISLGLDAIDLVFLHEGRMLYARSVAMDLRGALTSWISGQAEGGGAVDLSRLAMAAHMIDCLKLDENPDQVEILRWIERLGQELQRTYDFARREMKCPPIRQVWLTGEGAALRHLDELLARSADLQVGVLNPVGSLPGAAQLKFTFGGLEFTSAFGALIGRHEPGAYAIDLTPASHYRDLARRSLMRRLTATGVLTVIAAGCATGVYLKYQQNQKLAYDDYRRANQAMETRIAELEVMQTKTKILEGYVKDPHAALEVFNSIVAANDIPGRLFLDSADYERGRSVTIRGWALELPDRNNLVTHLNQTGHFSNVIPSQHSEARMPVIGQPAFSFTIEADLVGQGGNTQ